MTAAQPTIHALQNLSVVVENNTLSMVKNKTDTNNQQPRTVNKKILMCIQIFGCVDIFLICAYFALCLYDRQHLTIGIETTFNNIPRNNSTYENVEIFFISATGNKLHKCLIVIRVRHSAWMLLKMFYVCYRHLYFVYTKWWT